VRLGAGGASEAFVARFLRVGGIEICSEGNNLLQTGGPTIFTGFDSIFFSRSL
jgi:hypothetical protein